MLGLRVDNARGRRRLRVGLALVLASGLLVACGPQGAGDNQNNASGCDLGQIACGGSCVNTQTSYDHCGECFHSCNPGELCDGVGVCTLGGCQPGLTQCGSTCVNTTTDPNNCGFCQRTCAAGEICNQGDCLEDTCSETSSVAQSGVLPADIIIVVDNSGSMTEEAAFVQAAMNQLVSVIWGSAVDAHVILISADSNDSQGICVPAPLGSGSCPNDEKLPEFRHVATDVASSNALSLIISTYDQWKGNLRQGASRTFAVITDDNSSMSAQAFTNGLLGLTPPISSFKFHAIFAPYEIDSLVCFPCFGSGNCAACDTCCGPDPVLAMMCLDLPASEGTVYRELCIQTGGIQGNLCTQDFLPVFQDMGTAVVNDAQLSCVYDIPAPPGGEEIDYGKVNVEFTDSPGGTPQPILYIEGGLPACGPTGGWYYDDPPPGTPTQVIFCPATCSQVQASTNGSVDVKFGCATVIG